MSKVFITRAIPGRAEAILAEAGHDVSTWPGDLPPTRPELLAALAGADAAMTMVTDRIDAELLAACPGLRIAANMAVGYDNLDCAAGDAAGTWMTNTPGILHRTTAELAMALILSATRHIVASDRDTRAGGWKTWSPTAFLGLDLHSSTLGIVGLGEIGLSLAEMAVGFGGRVVYSSRTRKPADEERLGLDYLSLDDLLEQSDIVSLHVPRTPETLHLLSTAQFARMKRGAILVNTARGTVVDQDALVESLRSGHLGGAALDVTDPEPLPLKHPLYSFANVIITPHIASASTQTRGRMAELAAKNIIAVLKGETPSTPVNRPANPR